MALLSEIKVPADWGGKLWRWYQRRMDPAFLQATRLIAAFEAHGVRRQQIARLMPPSLAVESAAFSAPQKLVEKLSPALLDWAANLLVLNRPWLDGVADHPHTHVEGYKNLQAHTNWLRARLANAPLAPRLLVWRAAPGSGFVYGVPPLSVVYSERTIGLDGEELPRYWTLSRDWRLDHAPCLEQAAALEEACRELRLGCVAREKPAPLLRAFERGEKLAPELDNLGGKLWSPSELLADSRA